MSRDEKGVLLGLDMGIFYYCMEFAMEQRKTQHLFVKLTRRKQKRKWTNKVKVSNSDTEPASMEGTNKQEEQRQDIPMPMWKMDKEKVREEAR